MKASQVSAIPTARSNVSRVIKELSKVAPVDIKRDVSPLGIFKVSVDCVEVADYFLNMNIDSEATGQYDMSSVSNRGKKSVALARLRHAMSSGKWDPNNGETIKIATGDSGNMLIDGQHRMQAIRDHLADGGKPVEVTVLCGMDPKSVLTIDTGSSRTVADFLVMCSGGAKSENMYSQDVSSAGRFCFRAENNIDSHPLKKPVDLEVTEGDIAEWLMESGVASELRQVRHTYSQALSAVSNKRGGNAGAKSWMTYLMWEWLKLDQKLAIEVLGFLSSGQLVELPKFDNGKPMKHWEYAREYAVQASIEGQGFRGANKAIMDKTVLAYAMAWNMSRGDRTHKRICGQDSFEKACDTYWDSGTVDKNGNPVWRKVPKWPGIL